MTNDELEQACLDVLINNNRGGYTIPTEGLYPHQWLWDSCFIAIGQRHADVERAQLELKSLLRGQWHNGMLPNMVLNNGLSGRAGSNFWQSNVSVDSPDDQRTSGISQPPMLAEAVVMVGEKLSKAERLLWYKEIYPALLANHKWHYAERDLLDDGLITLVHPWETGLDNTPPWMSMIHDNTVPHWVKLVKALSIDKVITKFRSDHKFVPAGERLTTLDGLSLYALQRQLRRQRYDITKIIKHSKLLIQDINYNVIFIRANQHLRTIAKAIDKTLPNYLTEKMKQTETSLELLWDPYSKNYYSRDANTGQLIKVPSIGTIVALYSGIINPDRAKIIIKKLYDNQQFFSKYPVASVPLNSSWFSPRRYWQGPTWINTNWLIVDGLKRSGFDKEATGIIEQSLELVKKSGCREYFSPKSGKGAGAHDFSWTAALTVDLLYQITDVKK